MAWTVKLNDWNSFSLMGLDLRRDEAFANVDSPAMRFRARQARSLLEHGKMLQDRCLATYPEKAGCMAAQPILAFLTGQGDSVIPTAPSCEHLAEDIASLFLRLDAAASNNPQWPSQPDLPIRLRLGSVPRPDLV
jgi:aryl-alcohol dehydrogenase-like predicted oxidoreductase